MESANTNEEELYLCTTDVHKAFDQVYREGTLYLLHVYGIRGKLLNMIKNWILTNIATPLWRGVKGKSVHLKDNGLRQGCTLSPILYLVILNTISDDSSGTPMPNWDNEFIHEVYSNDFDKLEDSDSCSVFVFVDDLILLGKSEKHLQELIDAYRNFTKKWRIRVNAGKCAIIPVSKHCLCTMGDCDYCESQWELDETYIQMKKKHKYLGVTLGTNITFNDYIKEKTAIVIQSKPKVSLIREKLGEGMAMWYVQSVLMPKILYCAEIIKIPESKIQGWQALLVSARGVAGCHPISRPGDRLDYRIPS